MEQYAHVLIPAEASFAPEPARVPAFFDLIQTEFQFVCIRDQKNWMPGLRVHNSSEQVRVGKNTFTGEQITLKLPKWFDIENTSEILPLIAGEPKFGVMMSGKWPLATKPIRLLGIDGAPFEQDPICFVRCAQRAAPVCTGDWWGEGRQGACEFGFGKPESPVQSTGVFTHPWTGKRLEIPNAGSARFWIQFEFGKWLLPEMTDTFDVLRTDFREVVEACFSTRFTQAGIATG